MKSDPVLRLESRRRTAIAATHCLPATVAIRDLRRFGVDDQAQIRNCSSGGGMPVRA